MREATETGGKDWEMAEEMAATTVDTRREPTPCFLDSRRLDCSDAARIAYRDLRTVGHHRRRRRCKRAGAEGMLPLPRLDWRSARHSGRVRGARAGSSLPAPESRSRPMAAMAATAVEGWGVRGASQRRVRCSVRRACLCASTGEGREEAEGRGRASATLVAVPGEVERVDGSHRSKE